MDVIKQAKLFKIVFLFLINIFYSFFFLLPKCYKYFIYNMYLQSTISKLGELLA